MRSKPEFFLGEEKMAYTWNYIYLGVSINALPPFQNSLDSPYLNITKVEKNRVIQIDIMKLDNWGTWISPPTSLGRNMAHSTANVLHISEDGFIITTSYMETNLLFICLKSSYQQSRIWPALFLNLWKTLFLKNTNKKKHVCIKSQWKWELLMKAKFEIILSPE